MDDERLLLILPEPGEQEILLVTSKGRSQAFHVENDVALEAFVKGMGDYTALSILDRFDEVVTELKKIHVPVDMPADKQLGMMTRSMFRYAEIQ